LGGDGGEVAGRLQRSLGALLLLADPIQHSLDRFGDLHRLLHAADLHFVGVGLRVDGPGLLGQQPEGVDHDQRDDPGGQHRTDDDAAADQQHPQVQFVDPTLGFGQRGAERNRRPAGGEGADPVLDTVDVVLAKPLSSLGSTM
jgi:hypothetical protein